MKYLVKKGTRVGWGDFSESSIHMIKMNSTRLGWAPGEAPGKVLAKTGTRIGWADKPIKDYYIEYRLNKGTWRRAKVLREVNGFKTASIIFDGLNLNLTGTDRYASTNGYANQWLELRVPSDQPMATVYMWDLAGNNLVSKRGKTRNVASVMTFDSGWNGPGSPGNPNLPAESAWDDVNNEAYGIAGMYIGVAAVFED